MHDTTTSAFVVDLAQFNAVVTDGVTEASDLGMPAGLWPQVIQVGATRWQRGPKLPTLHGRFTGYAYVLPGTTLRLTVYND